MLFLQQNESVATCRQIFLQMVDAADYATPRTGLTPTVTIVKPGGTAYAGSTAGVVEIGSGTYRIDLASSDLDTLGSVMLKIAAPGAANQYVPLQVVRFPDEVHLAKSALVNARTHVVETGVNQIRDDDGATVLRTLTPSEAAGIVTIAVG